MEITEIIRRWQAGAIVRGLARTSDLSRNTIKKCILAAEREAEVLRLKQVRKTRWETGAKDPALLKDISNTEIAFKSADAEVERYIRAYRQHPETEEEVEAARRSFFILLYIDKVKYIIL